MIITIPSYIKRLLPYSEMDYAPLRLILWDPPPYSFSPMVPSLRTSQGIEKEEQRAQQHQKPVVPWLVEI